MIDLLTDYARYLETELAASSVATYLDVLRRLDRQLPVGLARAHSDELKAAIYIAGHTAATRKLRRAAVRGFFDWACDPAEPHLDFNPARLLPRVKVPVRRPKPIPVDQLYDILRRAHRPWRDWFVIAAYTGARCVELAALERDDITVRGTLLHGKGSTDRFVPTHPLVWATGRELPPGLVAGGLDRQQISHRGNYYLQKVLGHKGVHMHRLRHSFGTAAYEATKDIRAVQELLGHQSPATTAMYVAASPAALEAAVAGLPVASC